ncbi:MAG: cytochrome c biogenesis protein ResB [Oligoflexia bacterium]|nr:cytochrome c biogenesis protein ResB [Oligoflexia bacterium]
MNFLVNLKSNRVFKFMASVRFSVPLMVFLIVALAWGTILESRYHADLAKLRVYDAWWFELILLFLWLNILASTINRFKVTFYHFGFLVTHLGLLILLASSVASNRLGIDGLLILSEGGTGNTVHLNKMGLQFVDNSGAKISIPVSRANDLLTPLRLSAINMRIKDIWTITNLIPFSQTSRVAVASTNITASTGPAVEVELINPFISYKEWLQNPLQKSIDLGPLYLALTDVSDRFKSTLGSLTVYNSANVPEARFELLENGPRTFQHKGLTIRVDKVLKKATVLEKQLVESRDSGSNPAIAMSVQWSGRHFKESLFADFPDFTLNPGGFGGYSLRYEKTATVPQDKNALFIKVKDSNQVEMVYFEKGSEVKRATANLNEKLLTPWMGMTVSVKNIFSNAAFEFVVREAPLEVKASLPPPAILIENSQTKEKRWLQPGDRWNESLSFENQTRSLPFTIKLLKFIKTDYPGTETAKSFESEVELNDGSRHTISMNEPLKKDGFTIYQSSFGEDEFGNQTSTFSVNQDPAREIKYFGSIVLGLGIMIFTLSRSQRFGKWLKTLGVSR